MFQRRGFRDFEFRKFEFVSDWSETDASPDIRISDFVNDDYHPFHSCYVELNMPRSLESLF